MNELLELKKEELRSKRGIKSGKKGAAKEDEADEEA